eukprot:6265261-Pyramimonas_sp.AAC.1
MPQKKSSSRPSRSNHASQHAATIQLSPCPTSPNLFITYILEGGMGVSNLSYSRALRKDSTAPRDSDGSGAWRSHVGLPESGLHCKQGVRCSAIPYHHIPLMRKRAIDRPGRLRLSVLTSDGPL